MQPLRNAYSYPAKHRNSAGPMSYKGNKYSVCVNICNICGQPLDPGDEGNICIDCEVLQEENFPQED